MHEVIKVDIWDKESNEKLSKESILDMIRSREDLYQRCYVTQAKLHDEIRLRVYCREHIKIRLRGFITTFFDESKMGFYFTPALGMFDILPEAIIDDIAKRVETMYTEALLKISEENRTCKHS